MSLSFRKRHLLAWGTARHLAYLSELPMVEVLASAGTSPAPLTHAGRAATGAPRRMHANCRGTPALGSSATGTAARSGT
jgi:hypothetical protein